MTHISRHRSKLIVVAILFGIVVFILISSRQQPQPSLPAPPATGPEITQPSSSGVEFDPQEKLESRASADPAGKKFFSVSGGGKNGPRLVEGFIDPYFPKIGDTQTIAVKALDSVPITKVSVTLRTDSKSEVYPLTLEAGTDLEGIWQGSWEFNDSYAEQYVAIVKATSERGTTQIEITLR